MEVICLDTDILIDHKRSKSKVKTHFYEMASRGFLFVNPPLIPPTYSYKIAVLTAFNIFCFGEGIIRIYNI